MRLFSSAGVVAALLFAIPSAQAQPAAIPVSAGPGKVTCKSAASCEVGIGDPAKIKYQVDISALPAADKERLSKHCGASAKPPCVATVTGTENGDPLKVKGATIKWFN